MSRTFSHLASVFAGASVAFLAAGAISQYATPSKSVGIVWFFTGSAAVAFATVLNMVTQHYLNRAKRILDANEECEAKLKDLIQRIKEGSVR